MRRKKREQNSNKEKVWVRFARKTKQLPNIRNTEPATSERVELGPKTNCIRLWTEKTRSTSWYIKRFHQL
jgi:hypothetical protein